METSEYRGYCRRDGKNVIVLAEPVELYRDYPGNSLDIADCGGWGVDTLFSSACRCGRECHSGYREVISSVEQMPQELVGALQALEALDHQRLTRAEYGAARASQIAVVCAVARRSCPGFVVSSLGEEFLGEEFE